MKSQQLSFSNPEIRSLTKRYILYGTAALGFILVVAVLSLFDWAAILQSLWTGLNS